MPIELDSMATTSGTPLLHDSSKMNAQQSGKQRATSSAISVISLSSNESPKNAPLIDLTSDNDAEMPQQLLKAHSTSSELTELSSDNGKSSRNDPTSSEDTEPHPDDAMGDTSSTNSSSPSNSSNTSSEETGSDDDNTSTNMKKGPARDERIRLRDILNKKLEQMFSKCLENKMKTSLKVS